MQVFCFLRFITLVWWLFFFSFILTLISRYWRFFLLLSPSSISLPFLSWVLKSRGCFCTTQAIISGCLKTSHFPTVLPRYLLPESWLLLLWTCYDSELLHTGKTSEDKITQTLHTNKTNQLDRSMNGLNKMECLFAACSWQVYGNNHRQDHEYEAHLQNIPFFPENTKISGIHTTNHFSQLAAPVCKKYCWFLFSRFDNQYINPNFSTCKTAHGVGERSYLM